MQHFFYNFPNLFSRIFIVFLATFLLLNIAHANIYKKKWIDAEQKDIPNVEKNMLTAKFWQEKWEDTHGPDSGDEAISKKTINLYNNYVNKKGWVLDIRHNGSRLKTKLILSYISEDLSRLKNYIKYDKEGNRHRDPQFGNMAKKIIGLPKLEAQNAITIKYALVTKSANMLMLPGELFFSNHVKETDINILQNTHLSATTAITVYWISADGKYAYAQSPHARGWVPLENITFISKEKLNSFLDSPNSLIVLSHSATFKPAEKNSGLAEIILPMGTPLTKWLSASKPNRISKQKYLFPVANIKANIKNANIKNKEENNALQQEALFSPYYLSSGKVGEPLKLTRNNLLQQMFESLGTAYAWGGGINKTDCSLFFQNVFASFGMHLPRSSGLQTTSFGNFFNNQKIAKTSISVFPETNPPALAQFLYLTGPSHIMVSLGEEDGKEYVIHSTRGMDETEDVALFLKKVVVSTTSMGEGKPNGNLINRVKKRVNIALKN